MSTASSRRRWLFPGLGVSQRTVLTALGTHVELDFFRTRGTDASYCLRSGGWHVVVAQSGADTRVSRARGPCPEASVDRRLGPTTQELT